MSLFAYDHMESEFITRVLGQIMGDKCVVFAKVRHSQWVNDLRVQLENHPVCL